MWVQDRDVFAHPWLLPLKVIFSRHLCWYGYQKFVFVFANILLYKHPSLYLPFYCGHLGLFQFGALIDKATARILLCFSLGKIPAGGNAKWFLYTNIYLGLSQSSQVVAPLFTIISRSESSCGFIFLPMFGPDGLFNPCHSCVLTQGILLWLN